MKDHMLDLIDPYLDGELMPTDRSAVDAHLAGCRECGEVLAQRRRLSELVKELPPARQKKTDREFIRQVMAGIKRSNEAGEKIPPAPDLGWIGIPLLLVIGLAFIQTAWLESSVMQYVPRVGEALESGRFLLPFAFALPSAVDNWIGYFLGWNLSSWTLPAALLTSAALGIIYISWLAGWWIKGQKQTNIMEMEQ